MIECVSVPEIGTRISMKLPVITHRDPEHSFQGLPKQEKFLFMSKNKFNKEFDVSDQLNLTQHSSFFLTNNFPSVQDNSFSWISCLSLNKDSSFNDGILSQGLPNNAD
jgi:hypothetical protein